MYRVLAVILTIFVSNIAFALDAEYKNSLSGIDLNKTSESSYNINLYTSKEISQPVKVIKKSDLSYYILLPETNNKIENTVVNNGDIRSIETQLFPYAGSDVQNGYTKININTTKPIKFNINTKIASASNTTKPIIKENQTQEIKTAASDAKVQKKNLVQESQKPKSNNIEKKNIASPKKQIEPAVKKDTEPTAMAAAKIPIKKQNVVKEESQKPQQPEQPTVVTEDIEEVQETIVEDNNNEVIEEVSQETEQIVNEEKPVQKIAFKTKLLHLGQKFKNKLGEYGLNIREFILMITAGFLSFIVMLLFLTKGKDSDTRLKSKSSFLDINLKKSSSLIPKKDTEGQYFVFDKNVKQTGFIAPATSEKKNYELSSYEPSIRNNTRPVVEPYYGKQGKSEYDIIQNILREDSFIDYNSNEPVLSDEYVNSPIATQQQIAAPKTKIANNDIKDEPEVLSNVEIAPQRGFMCVSYNNSISLVGYIFDDVFALYNFQQPKLENYNIKFRLSEKTQHGANFIVRVDKSKMLVNVTKSSMNLELAM